MVNYEGYDILKFNGSFLIPGFSIYLLEIIKGDDKFFYIGMTGDPFYPSARSGFHRLAGHLENAERSTQNQLWVGLREKAGIIDPNDFFSLKIKMHHFPIPGFVKWSGKSLHHEEIKASMHLKEYTDYETMQKNILALEKALINAFPGEILLNKTRKTKSEYDFGKYQPIFDGIKFIIEDN